MKRKKFTELKDRQSGYSSPHRCPTLIDQVDKQSGEKVLDNIIQINKPYEDIITTNEYVPHGS